MKTELIRIINLISALSISVSASTDFNSTETFLKSINVNYRFGDYSYESKEISVPEDVEDVVIDCFYMYSATPKDVICDLDKKCYRYYDNFKQFEASYRYIYEDLDPYQCNIYTSKANDPTPSASDYNELVPICRPTPTESLRTFQSVVSKMPCTKSFGDDENETTACSSLVTKATYTSTISACQTYTNDPNFFIDHTYPYTTQAPVTTPTPTPTTSTTTLPSNYKLTTIDLYLNSYTPEPYVMAVPSEVAEIYNKCHFLNLRKRDEYEYEYENENENEIPITQAPSMATPTPIPTSSLDKRYNGNKEYICDDEFCIGHYTDLSLGKYVFCEFYTSAINDPIPTTDPYKYRYSITDKICHTSYTLTTTSLTSASLGYTFTTEPGEPYDTVYMYESSGPTIKTYSKFHCGPRTATSTETETIKPTVITDPTCPKAAKLGYPCCTHCKSIYEDDDGLWGVENNKWCGIPDHCNEDTCWSIKKGYPCCDTCTVYYEDEDGQWGVMNNEWCGIPSTCK